jgi:hypothetical protein
MQLEPRHELRYSEIIGENDEINEVTFITKGKIVLGYEINY